jgi:uncharacterized protein (DUF58 family)
MRRLGHLTLALVATASLAYGANYVAYEQITVAGTAVGFTAAKITPPGRIQAQVATCRLETAEIRYTVDGVTTPTSTVGTPLEPLETITFNGHDVLEDVLFIRTGASGSLNCVYSTP